jgi:hypothetical protein
MQPKCQSVAWRQGRRVKLQTGELAKKSVHIQQLAGELDVPQA